MNNKGFATSTIIYMLIIVFSMLIFSTVVLSSNENKIESESVENAKDLLNVYNEKDLDFIKKKAYRYVTSNGTWSNWIAYENMSEIDHTVSLTKIINRGSKGSSFDQTTVSNVNLVIQDGVPHLDFNGTNSSSKMTTTTAFTVSTIYIKFKTPTTINATRGINKVFTLNLNNSKGLIFGNCTGYLYNETITFVDVSPYPKIGTTTAYPANTEMNIILTWNSSTSSYDMYINGIKNPGRITHGTFPTQSVGNIALGYNAGSNNQYINMDLYDAIFSTATLTQAKAMELSAGNIDPIAIFGQTNTNVRYGDYIEFGEYINNLDELP